MKNNILITEEINRIKEIMGLSLITEQNPPLISGAASEAGDALAQRIAQQIEKYIPDLIKTSASKEIAGLSKNTALNLLKDVAGAKGQNPEVYRNKTSILSKQPLIKGNKVNLSNLDSKKLIDGFKSLNKDTQIGIIKKYIDSMVQNGQIPPELVASEMKLVKDMDYQWALWWASNGNILPKKNGELIKPKDANKYLTMDFGEFMDLQGVPKSVQNPLYKELAPALSGVPNLNPKYGGENEARIQKSSKATVKPRFNKEQASEALFQNLSNFTNIEINPKRIYNGIMTGNEPELEEVRIWLQDPKNKDQFINYLQSKSDVGKQQEEFLNYLQREGVYEPEKINILRRALYKCRAKKTLPQGTKFGLFGGIKELGQGNFIEYTDKVWWCRWMQSFIIYRIVLSLLGTAMGYELIMMGIGADQYGEILQTWSDKFKDCTEPDDQDKFLRKDPYILSNMKNFVTGDPNKERTIDLIVNNKLYYKANYNKIPCQQQQLFVLIPGTELDGITIDPALPSKKYAFAKDAITKNYYLSEVDEITAKDSIWSTIDQKMKDLKQKAEDTKQKFQGNTPTVGSDNNIQNDTAAGDTLSF